MLLIKILILVLIVVIINDKCSNSIIFIIIIVKVLKKVFKVLFEMLFLLISIVIERSRIIVNVNFDVYEVVIRGNVLVKIMMLNLMFVVKILWEVFGKVYN